MSWAGRFNFRWLLLESDVFWSALRTNLVLMRVRPLGVVPGALGLAAGVDRGGVGGGAVGGGGLGSFGPRLAA